MSLEKPKVKYSDFLKSKVVEDVTVALLIERYIAEMETVKPCGDSQKYVLRAMARRAIGAKAATSLKHGDIIEYARTRRQERVIHSQDRLVGAATAGQELSYLSVVLKYAGPAWDCAGVTAAAILSAKPWLMKQGVIGKSAPRDRRPTAEELVSLEAIAHERNKQRGTKIDLVKLARWQIASCRRVSETCRIEWRGWNEQDQTMLVTKVKDPRTRNKTKQAALTSEAQAMLYELAWEMNARPETWGDREPRIFPWNSKSASQAYADIKRKAGVQGLRLHDSRREGCTRLIEAGYKTTQAIMVSLHETDAIFQRNYMRQDPASFKDLQP